MAQGLCDLTSILPSRLRNFTVQGHFKSGRALQGMNGLHRPLLSHHESRHLCVVPGAGAGPYRTGIVGKLLSGLWHRLLLLLLLLRLLLLWWQWCGGRSRSNDNWCSARWRWHRCHRGFRRAQDGGGLKLDCLGRQATAEMKQLFPYNHGMGTKQQEDTVRKGNSNLNCTHLAKRRSRRFHLHICLCRFNRMPTGRQTEQHSHTRLKKVPGSSGPLRRKNRAEVPHPGLQSPAQGNSGNSGY